MKYFALAVLVSLGWLHHDWWFWEEPFSILGIPAGLGYHVMFSLATAGAWLLAVRTAWPIRIERWAEPRERPRLHRGPRRRHFS